MTCSYTGCEERTTVERRYIDSGEEYRYCSEHDPLADNCPDPVADYFEEV